MPSFIADGYTVKAGINAEPGIHDGLEFMYRPMTPGDVAEYVHDTEGLEGRALRAVTAKWLAKKIVKFQLSDGAECPEVTEDVFLDGTPCIHQILFTDVMNIVIWSQKPDYGDVVFEEAVKN